MTELESTYVLDASVTLAWLFGEADIGSRLERYADEGRLLAPSVWFLEADHVVLKRERQKKLDREQADRLLDALDAMAIEIVTPSIASFADLAALARPHQLSSYDVTYLQLAVDFDAVLVTSDQNLIDAAGRVGVPVAD